MHIDLLGTLASYLGDTSDGLTFLFAFLYLFVIFSSFTRKNAVFSITLLQRSKIVKAVSLNFVKKQLYYSPEVFK